MRRKALGDHLGPWPSDADARLAFRGLRRRADERRRGRRRRALLALALAPTAALAAALTTGEAEPPRERPATARPAARAPWPAAPPTVIGPAAVVPVTCPRAGLPAAEVRSSDAFVDGVGVTLRLAGRADEPHSPEQAAGLLDELGIRHVTDTVASAEDAERLRRTGRTVLARVPDETSLAPVAGILGPRLFAVTPDSARFARDRTSPEWPERARGLSRALHAAARPLGLSVVGGETGRRHAVDLGSLAEWVDLGRLQYPLDGYPPGNLWLEGALQATHALFPGKALVATSAGYTTAHRDRGVSEAKQAKYVPRLLFELAGRGVLRTYIRTLRDQGEDDRDLGARYGLVRPDGSRKPAFAAVRDLLALLNDPGPPHTPAPLPLAVEAADAPDLRHAVLGRRDGSYLAVLWLERPSEDDDARAEALVRLGWPVAEARWHLPGTGAPPEILRPQEGGLAVTVRDRVGLLELRPACAAP